MDVPGPLPFVGSPPLKYRFGVFFFAGGVIPNPLDILSRTVGVSTDPFWTSEEVNALTDALCDAARGL